MTLSELFQIGDKVVFKVDPEVRAWTNTYSDVPDGTVGVVCGFYDAIFYEPRVPVYDRPQGAYHQKGAVSVWLPDGRIVPGDNSITMVDKDEEKRRDRAARNADGTFRVPAIRLGNLPVTPFWEQDVVRVRFPAPSVWGEQVMTICRIEYSFMHERRHDGSPYPFYHVDFSDGGTVAVEESWIELIERGNVWKYFHDQPLSFSDLAAEAKFARLVGQAEEVRNPTNDLYSWTKDEVLAAIEVGVVHGFAVSSGLFGTGLHHKAIRFYDEGLGKRVAQATLEGFAATV